LLSTTLFASFSKSILYELKLWPVPYPAGAFVEVKISLMLGTVTSFSALLALVSFLIGE
jgi:hypothetical protein